jgi:signal transduction histidine kinase
MNFKRTKYRYLIAFALLLLSTAPTLAEFRDTVQINQNTSKLDFHTSVNFFIDSLNTFSRKSTGEEEMLRALKAKYSPGNYRGGDIWCSVFLQSKSAVEQVFVLELGGDKEVHVFYRPQKSQIFQERVTGNYIPFPLNEMGDKGFMDNKVKFAMEPEAVYEFIFFYPDQGFDQIQPKFVISGMESWESDWRIFFGKRTIIFLPFLGICLILALINFIYFFIHRDKAHAKYAAYIITCLLFAAYIAGMFDFAPLIHYPMLYHCLGAASLVLANISYIFFIKSFLRLRERFPFWDKFLNLLSVYLLLSFLLTIVLLIIPKIPITAFNLLHTLMLANIFASIALFVRVFRDRNIADQIFMTGTLVLVVASIINLIIALIKLDYGMILPIFEVAMVIELTIFSIGLGVRLRLSMREKRAAQQDLIQQLKKNDELQKSTKHQLEVLVQSRTAEIQTQNEELITQQEELAAQRDMLEDQNSIIAQSMNELQQIRAGLEKTVERRTAELKQTNVELVHRNDQLEQYAYITAHNLRAPVARVKGLIFLFEKTGGEQNENQGIFARISNSASEMDDVLSDMNAILEVKTNRLGRIDNVKIINVLEKVQKALGQDIIESGAALQVNIGVEDICGNRMYLESILYNLLSNSIKYRSAKRPLQIGLAVRKENGQVIMEVSDNGVGIDLKIFGDKVFKLYQRFHEYGEGKGLGLYLVKSHVEAMGGSIGIESEVDAGTSIKIVLPE